MTEAARSFSRPTLAGLAAIALWSVLALLTASTGALPPFQLSAITFTIASLLGLTIIFQSGRGLAVLRQPARAWALGLYGLFGYHALYFAALKLAPAAEAGLIAYLWPLLIVLMTTLLPGERLSIRHVIAALMSFAGIIVLGLGKGGMSFDASHVKGYMAALGCAFIWSSYSVLSRLQGDIPSESVTGFCMATAILSGFCHFMFETTIWPSTVATWLSILALGLGPVGAAFFLWDFGMKHGNIKLLGIASYAAPVISTILLVLLGYSEAHWTLALACILIVAGAIISLKR
jgi:drug/metabolite transporter (DMT)-like permease